jgi:hypothetical protein
MSKKIFIILSCFVLFLTGLTTAGQKRYEYKSGIVEYRITAKGNMYGMTITEEGNSRLVFKDYGNIQIDSENTITNSMGQKTVNKSLDKLDNDVLYSVDFQEKVITKAKLSELNDEMAKYRDVTALLKAEKAKKIGHEKILGYPCEIFQFKYGKIWIHKGIPLKSESDVMGMKRVEIATSAKFNININDKEFILPNYPIKSWKEMIQSEGKDQSSERQTSPEELQQMMKQFMGGKN